MIKIQPMRAKPRHSSTNESGELWLGPLGRPGWRVCVIQAQPQLILTLLAYHHVAHPGAGADHSQTRNVKIAPAKPLINYHNSNHYHFLPLSGCKNWPDIDSKLHLKNCHFYYPPPHQMVANTTQTKHYYINQNWKKTLLKKRQTGHPFSPEYHTKCTKG